MNHLVLFDMDGTLTPPRESLEESLIPVLEQLAEVAEIGIVTGILDIPRRPVRAASITE